MAVDVRSPEEIKEEQDDIAEKIKGFQKDILECEDLTEKYEKSQELAQSTTRLEMLNMEHEISVALKNAEKFKKALEKQPARVAPTSYSGTVQGSFSKTDGGITGGFGNVGFDDAENEPARLSAQYAKAFSHFVKAKGDISNVRSSDVRNTLERFGKSEGFQNDEFHIPFSKAMTLGPTTNGSNAVPVDFMNEIITQRTITPVMARLVRQIPTTKTRVTFPRNSDSGATPQVGTGFASTKGEQPNTTLSEKSTGPFTQLNIDINTGTMWTAVSLDFFDDVLNAQSYIVTEGQRALSAAYDNEVPNGVTGNGQCEGVLNCASVGITKTGVNNTLVDTKIVEAWYGFRSHYATSLAAIGQRPTHGKLINLKDANNRSLFMPIETGLSGDSPQRILGTPFYYNEYMPTSGTSLPKSIIVGDWFEYLLAMRSGVSVTIDTVSWARYNLAIITWRYRFGGAVRDPRAFNIVHESA